MFIRPAAMTSERQSSLYLALLSLNMILIRYLVHFFRRKVSLKSQMGIQMPNGIVQMAIIVYRLITLWAAALNFNGPLVIFQWTHWELP